MPGWTPSSSPPAPRRPESHQTEEQMKPVTYALTAGLLVLATQAPLIGKEQGHGKGKNAVETSHTTVNADVHVVFSSHDVQIIREHYAPQYRNLPPGLQKKYARTGKLPPGWQKKMAPLPVEVERQLVRTAWGLSARRHRRPRSDLQAGHVDHHRRNGSVLVQGSKAGLKTRRVMWRLWTAHRSPDSP